MCGITGFINDTTVSNTERMEGITSAMVQSLSHRGPDSSGVWVNATDGIALGHSRLSILDISQAGHQPMISQSGQYVMTYNGEIYNYKSLSKRLRNEGIEFKGNSDTEVLLEAIASWGLIPTLHSINGMFALAIWDRQSKQLFLVRDRIGKKPLYYGWQGGNFYFASETRAIRQHPDFHSKIDENALTSFFRYSYIPNPQCIYKDIQKLPQGSYAVIDTQKKNVAVNNYWCINQGHSDSKKNRLSDSETIAEADELIQSSVSKRLMGDVSVGAFLSGGVDSSLVVAHMQKASTCPVKTFTIGFQEEKFNEANEAKAIAQHLGTQHSEYYVSSKELLESIPDLVKTFDEPFGDISQLPSFIVCKLARREVTVCLSGDGGDELFCGYDRYYSAVKKWDRLSKSPDPFRQAASIILKQIGHLHQSNDAWQRLTRLLQAKSSFDIFKLRSERLAIANMILRKEYRISMIEDEKINEEKTECDPMELMMRHDIRNWLVDDILVKMDRSSMANSLEVRNPLLDYLFVEYALSLPLKYKYRDGVSKWLLKQCLQQYVPENLTSKTKKGFSIPISDWLRGPLRDWAEDLLSSSTISEFGYLEEKTIKNIWKSFINGNNRYRNTIWNIIVFHSWMKNNEI